jgi:hypothetical protein
MPNKYKVKCFIEDKFDEDPILVEMDTLPPIGSFFTLPGNLRFKVSGIDFYFSEYIHKNETIYTNTHQNIDIYLIEL